MKKHSKLIGILFIVLGLISILFLLAKEFHLLEIDNSYAFAILTFVAILLPVIGIQLLRKKMFL